MEAVVPWKALLALIEPHYPAAGRGRRPYLFAQPNLWMARRQLTAMAVVRPNKA
jgi:hypothetical protein